MTRLDVRGSTGPEPVIRIRRALLGLAGGEILEVTADDKALIADLPAFCTNSGHRLIMAEALEDRMIFAIAARESVAAPDGGGVAMLRAG